MSTGKPFTRSTTIPALIPPCKSVGAHLAAKLDAFATDERTLTDELCDMLCIWLSRGTPPGTPASPTKFEVTVAKTTPAEEVKIGADLEIIVQSPLGSKRCLVQAKVLNPAIGDLRCSTKAGWKKLRIQLALARKQVGSLAFLLIYVPGRLLNGNHHGYSTYEQRFLRGASGIPDSYNGATLIGVDDLLGPSGRWRRPKVKVPRDSSRIFKNSIPFWRFFLELLLCRRGTWNSNVAYQLDGSTEAFRRLSVFTGGVSASEWRELQENAATMLAETETSSQSDQDD